MDLPYQWIGHKQLCTCGRDHEVSIEKIVISENMLALLRVYLTEASFQSILLVADSHTYEAFGREVHEYLRTGTSCHAKLLASNHELLPDEVAVSGVRGQIEEYSAEVVLAVGSGVINDVARYASYLEGIPYIVIPTAPSMDGYASSVAAMQFNGLKVTYPAQMAKAIFVHPGVLAAAPFELIKAGFGDLVGKITSLLDWKLSSTLFGENFCATCYEMVLTPLQFCVDHANDLHNRDQRCRSKPFYWPYQRWNCYGNDGKFATM